MANEDVLRSMAAVLRLDGSNTQAFAELLCEVYDQREGNDLDSFVERLTESGGRYGFGTGELADLRMVIENSGGFELLDDLCRYGRDTVLAEFTAALATDEPEAEAEPQAAEEGTAPAFDEASLFPWLAQQVRWDGAEAGWPAARAALLATAGAAGRQDISAAAEALASRLDGADRIAILAGYGIVITPPAEPAGFDEATVFPWLAAQLAGWDGADATWAAARDGLLATARGAGRPDLAAGAEAFASRLDTGDRITILAGYGVPITPPEPAAEFDESTVFPWLAAQLQGWDGADATWPAARAAVRATADDAGRPDLSAGASAFLAQLDAGDRVAVLAGYGVLITAPAATVAELSPEQIEAAVPELVQQLDAAAAKVDLPPDVLALVGDETVLREVLAEVPGAAELDAAGLEEVMQQVAAALAG